MQIAELRISVGSYINSIDSDAIINFLYYVILKVSELDTNTVPDFIGSVCLFHVEQ
jgi:hypothetical protein